VIDAGSTDGTADRLKQYRKEIVPHFEKNIGQSGAFELCQRLDADCFMFCDGDDILDKDRLKRIIDVFITYPDVILVGNSINEVDFQGNQLRSIFVGHDQFFEVKNNEEDGDRLYLARCLLGTSRMAVRKQPLMDIMPIERRVLFEADEYIFTLLPCLGKVCILADRLTDYRLHGANSYQNSKVRTYDQVHLYRKVHENLLVAIITGSEKLKLDNVYLSLCIENLKDLCGNMQVLEKALHSRRKAIELIFNEPLIVGLTATSLLKRYLLAFAVFLFGLRPTLLVGSLLRHRVVSRKKIDNVELL